MAIKDQFKTLKDNWLIVLLVVLVLGFILVGGGSSNLLGSHMNGLSKSMNYEVALADSYSGGSSPGYGRSYPSQQDDFAPEVKERKITKSSNLRSEVERGQFESAESKLKSIIDSSDSYLLNQNVNSYGSGLSKYKGGSYTIKVDSEKYDSIINQLKDIGEVTYFNENADDITGTYQDISVEIEVEKNRLERFKKMLDESETVENKIKLTDRIFNLERTIKYYEDRLKNMDNKVTYSTISYSITEKRSDYGNIVFVKFSDLVRKLVSSASSLISFVFIILPWAIGALIIWWILKLFRRNKSKKR